jgi:hypothetical protein
MAADWFYTSNKQQMGPVSWDELRQLGVSGLVKRDDLVWTEGMPEWVKAERQNGVFPDAAVAVQIGADVPPPPPALRAPWRDRDDDRDESPRDERRGRRDDEDRDARPKGRRDRKKSGGSGAGLWIGLGVGALVLVLLVVGCGAIGLIVWLTVGRGGEEVGPAGVNYNISLAPGGNDRRTFTLRGGQRINISVVTTRVIGPFQPDVDLFVERRGAQIAADVRVHPDCSVTFVAPANDTYTVRVTNLGPGRASSRVAITAN